MYDYFFHCWKVTTVLNNSELINLDKLNNSFWNIIINLIIILANYYIHKIAWKVSLLFYIYSF